MTQKTHLFSPFRIGDVTLPNRIAVSPMCQYASEDGFSNDWHLVHLGSRASGGAGLIFTEAAAVTPEGRITPGDLGLWKDAHIAGLERIAAFLHSQGAWAGIQLAHAGRKASMAKPWETTRSLSPEEGGWTNVLAPSALPYAENYSRPIEMTAAQIRETAEAFSHSARRARQAGFDAIEIHAAHGYLLHSFLSPLSNQRTDSYGGSFENRTRLLLEVTAAIRREWPEERPLFVRISATDWAEGGWEIEQSIQLADILKRHGVHLIDVSSGGLVPKAKVPVGPGYQTPFAERIRREAGIPAGAVGMITAPAQAEHILRTGQADLIVLGRAMLRDPYWPLNAARELGEEQSWPVEYLRAAPPGSPARRQAGAASV